MGNRVCGEEIWQTRQNMCFISLINGGFINPFPGPSPCILELREKGDSGRPFLASFVLHNGGGWEEREGLRFVVDLRKMAIEIATDGSV